MLDYMTVKHVHADVIGELKLELEGFPGIKVPRLLHRFVGVTHSSISTDALLRDVVNVHGMRLRCRIRKYPLLGRAKGRPCVDSIGIEPLPIDCPMACCLIKAPVARNRWLSDIRQRAQRWWN